MTVFQLNYAHATGEPTFNVEPVCLSDAGIGLQPDAGFS
jgi:hypothetical protein